MIKRVRINTIRIFDKDAQGNALVTKTNKPYRKATIQTDEFGLSYITGFIWDEKSPILSWKQGDFVDVIITKKPYNGKEYLNFEVPKKDDVLESRIEALEKKVAVLESQLEGAEVLDEPEPVEDLKPEELPF